MARGQDPRPPREMLGRAVDVDPRAREPQAGDVPPVQPFYVNDVQPTVETDGQITLVCAYQGSGGTGEAVAITMPFGLFVEVAHSLPNLVAHSAARALKQAHLMERVAEGAGSDMEPVQKVRAMIEQYEAQQAARPQSGPVDLGSRRG